MHAFGSMSSLRACECPVAADFADTRKLEEREELDFCVCKTMALYALGRPCAAPRTVYPCPLTKLAEKPCIKNKISERSAHTHLFLQPSLLLAYLAVSTDRIATERAWRLHPKKCAPGSLLMA